MWKDAVLIRSYHRRMLSQEPLVMDKCRRWAARLRHSYWEGKKDQRKHAPLIWDLKSITGTCREGKKTSEASGQHCSSPSEGFPFSRRYQRHLKYCRQDHSSSLEERCMGGAFCLINHAESWLVPSLGRWDHLQIHANTR